MLNERATLLESLMTEFNRLGRSFHAAEVKQSAGRAKGSLGFVHYKLFSLVAEDADGIAVKDLASVLGVTPSAITQLVDPLVTHGYLVREADAKDRRSIRIKANPKNMSACEAFRHSYLDRMTDFFAPLSDTELQQCLQLVRKVQPVTRL